MRCPFCGNHDTQVKDSRPTEDNATIRRRRYCSACGSRFTTFERVHLRELTVVKSTGEKVTFDRDKVQKSMAIALRKRPVKDGQIDLIVNSIQRHLETSGETEIPSKAIGKLIMDRLMDLDKVAYVRFASVYKDFHEINDFNDFIGTLDEDEVL